ncbi:MAG: 1-phosphofructokinase [Sphaerochaetaceae bacterium]|nr:1-phosphofructokinase [Sphaerochaetaceae bacterium]
MIYTVTINPSLDYIVDVDDFSIGKVNRTSNELMFPGGKGINVSIVLNNLGLKTKALGFKAGFTGQEIKHLLDIKSITTEFIEVKEGFSRINLKMRSGVETEINGQGPNIGKSDLEKLMIYLDRIQDDDILVLAGSIPSILPSSLYMDIMKRLSNKKTKIVVDATQSLLVNVLQYHPFLIKPNIHELGEIFNVTLKTKAECVIYAKKLQKKGARNVLVSMAKEGAVLVTEDGEIFQSKGPEGKAINSVGAGDSMVAGFLAGYLKTGEYSEALKYGLCAGTASACSENLATLEQVNTLLHKTIFNF